MFGIVGLLAAVRWTGDQGITQAQRWEAFHNVQPPVGSTLNFYAYIGSGPASTDHPKKISGISSTPKIFEILATLKNIPILYFALKKIP